jgi:hypothetical protein
MNWVLPPRPAKVVRPLSSPAADVQELSSAVSDPSKLSFARSMCLPCQRRALDNRYASAASTSVNRAEQLQIHHQTDPTGEGEAALLQPPDEGSCHLTCRRTPDQRCSAMPWGALGMVASRSILPREVSSSINVPSTRPPHAERRLAQASLRTPHPASPLMPLIQGSIAW